MEAFTERECEIGQVDRDALYKGYYHGMRDFMSLPISDRLTEEEKKKMERCYLVEKETVAEHYRYAIYGLGQELKAFTDATLCDKWHCAGEEYGRTKLLEALFPDLQQKQQNQTD